MNFVPASRFYPPDTVYFVCIYISMCVCGSSAATATPAHNSSHFSLAPSPPDGTVAAELCHAASRACFPTAGVVHFRLSAVAFPSACEHCETILDAWSRLIPQAQTGTKLAQMPSKARDERHDEDSSSHTAFSRQTRRVRDLFSIPSPVKRLFDQVPVVIYPPNQLPQRAPKPARIPSLYVFIKEEDAAAGKPSYNPSCLKWQTFLNIAGVDHRLVSSNNHASPTGVLPFLLPAVHASNVSEEKLLPIPSNKLVKYVEEHQAKVEESSSMRYEAYKSLLDHRIRNAWLYTLYLEPLNFSAVAYKLYVSPASSNLLVRASISHQLRSAAEAELLRHSSIIDTDDLYSEADKAFEALSILLGDHSWFFGSEKPSLFDASVFAYTQLLLDDSLGWEEKKLCRALGRRLNLVQHRQRLLVRYYGGS